jgi:antitoxin HigA-1
MTDYKAGPRTREPTHPGRILATSLAAAGLNANLAAPKLGVSKMTLGRIIKGEAPVSTEMALRFGKFFGNGAKLWLNLQADHDLWAAEQKMADELSRIETLPAS